MENVSKALEIAAGVLLAVMIMSLISYFFSRIGIWPQEQDKMESAEQLAKFNTEYTVYEKKAMYGVDVISCLNKAKSNNEKYAQSGAFFQGMSYEGNSEDEKKNRYYINIYLNIKNPLEEGLEVYYLKDGKTIQSFEGTTSIKMKDVEFVFGGYTDFKETDTLTPKTNYLTDPSKYMVANGGDETYNGKQYYALRSSDRKLYNLLNYAGNNMKQVVTNTSGKNLDVWSRAIWSTALYDFKTKRFKCDYIGYNSVTGRVDKIYFSEL